jgi:hypothetical protein
MSSETEPAFDWAQAASLLGDDPNSVEPDMAEIARELVEGAKVQFADLKTKDPETDRKGIGAAAHALRGCLLNFGFTEVGTLLLQLEKGNFPSAEYLARVDQAEAVFNVSRKLLGERYPALELA